MFIKTIELNNYRIYYHKNSIDFNSQDGKNISIVSGYNGFGKTTFLTSLVWCLYGANMQEVDPVFKKKIINKGGYRKFLTDSINYKALSQNETHCNVSITFSDVQIPGVICDQICIQRSYTLGSQSDKLEIFIDGEENELVKEIGNDVFIQDFLLPKEIAKFFFFDAEEITSIAEIISIEDKRKLSRAYSEVLGIKKYEDLKENLSNLKLRYIKDSASADDQTKLEEAEIEVENLESEISALDLSIQKNQNTKEELKSKSAEYQLLLIREGSSMTTEEILKLRKEKEKLLEEKTQIQNSFKEMLTLLPLAMNKELLKDIENQVATESSFSDENTKVQLKNQLTDIQKEINDLLMDDTKSKKQIKTIFQRRLTNFSQEENKEAIHAFTMEETLSLKALINNIETNFKSRLDDINRRVKINKSELHKISRILSNSETKQNDKVILDIRNQKKEVDNSIAQLEIDNLKFSENKGELSNLIISKIRYRDELRKKVKISSKYTQKDQLVDKLNGNLEKFVSEMKKEKKKSLERKILNSLTTLMHKKDFVKQVSIEIVQDLIDIKLLNSRGVEIKKENFSKGEKQLYATALLKSLVEESNIHFPVFIDSPLQKFDERHSDSVILKFYPSISDQVVLFPLLNKELRKEEYEKIKSKINNSFIIHQIDEESSELITVSPNELFEKNQEININSVEHV